MHIQHGHIQMRLLIDTMCIEMGILNISYIDNHHACNFTLNMYAFTEYILHTCF